MGSRALLSWGIVWRILPSISTRLRRNRRSLRRISFARFPMKRASKNTDAEIEPGQRSQKLAEDESRLVACHLLDEAITEFLEWRAFSYWLRLCVETTASCRNLSPRTCLTLCRRLRFRTDSLPGPQRAGWRQRLSKPLDPLSGSRRSSCLTPLGYLRTMCCFRPSVLLGPQRSNALRDCANLEHWVFFQN